MKIRYIILAAFVTILILSSFQFNVNNMDGSGVIDLSNLYDYANLNLPERAEYRYNENNPLTDIGATLGRVLFYDKNLSVNNTVSCASCHQ